ncbi:MAG: type I methionyl aminopeptidase [Bacillota bacterium]|jgi:methionyl aminopeptidase|nr:type I methionyl aminopeptidase [Bacillota bacterium]HOB91634.1 type I methionyl aminopeptidase [Bacillota bacterium]HPZ54448.1 type I methionyl aminopeptidase [Bacillota bacterium]HQD17784.1 type I methionyl aminopeptidase [Bacillota bacterium]
MIVVKTKDQIDKMRKAGRVVAAVLQLMSESIRPGVTTAYLDRLAEEEIVRRGATPAFKGYRGYPATICASVNEEVIHGIPGDRVLAEGDIIGIDVGAVVDGYCGDAAATFPVGAISQESERLISTTREALEVAIKTCRVGKRIGDISHAVQSYVEAQGYSVVRDFVGHGIGRNMHEDPQVPNFGLPGTGPRLRPGLTIAIEPMVNEGTFEVEVLANEWTVVTSDRKRSAHFEHTVLITDDGPEILTVLR